MRTTLHVQCNRADVYGDEDECQLEQVSFSYGIGGGPIVDGSDQILLQISTIKRSDFGRFLPGRTYELMIGSGQHRPSVMTEPILTHDECEALAGSLLIPALFDRLKFVFESDSIVMRFGVEGLWRGEPWQQLCRFGYETDCPPLRSEVLLGCAKILAMLARVGR